MHFVSDHKVSVVLTKTCSRYYVFSNKVPLVDIAWACLEKIQWDSLININNCTLFQDVALELSVIKYLSIQTAIEWIEFLFFVEIVLNDCTKFVLHIDLYCCVEIASFLVTLCLLLAYHLHYLCFFRVMNLKLRLFDSNTVCNAIMYRYLSIEDSFLGPQ